MKITFVGRHMSVPEDMKDLLEKKLAKFDRYFSDEPDATVTFSRKRNRENIEVTISAGGTLFRCETDDETFRNAIDHAVDTIDRQIRRNKTRLAKRLRPDAFSAAAGALPADDNIVIRHKSFQLKPMSVEEAILQMNLLGHEFFMFSDAETGDACVVYTRRDGDYGLITPQK